jgi:hypothetical protein
MTTAYQKKSDQYATPSVGVAGSGCQQAASQSVIGYDAAVTPTLINQGIGLPAAPAGLEPYDGAVP